MLVRMIGGAIVSWLINFLWMPKLIELLKSWHFGQTIREDGPKSHMKKQGTPVMGGLGFTRPQTDSIHQQTGAYIVLFRTSDVI